MLEPMTITAVAALAGLAIGALAGLKAWQGWLELRRFELTGAQASQGRSPAMERIEIADLKERIRKLETIAAGVDL